MPSLPPEHRAYPSYYDDSGRVDEDAARINKMLQWERDNADDPRPHLRDAPRRTDKFYLDALRRNRIL